MTESNTGPTKGSNVTYLNPLSAVAILEDLLEKARAGEVSQVAFAACHPDGTISTSYSDGTQFFTLVGAVSWLHARMASPDES